MAVKKKKKAKPLLIILILIALFLMSIGITWVVMASPVNKKSDAKIEVVIPSGTTSRQIGTILKKKKYL